LHTKIARFGSNEAAGNCIPPKLGRFRAYINENAVYANWHNPCVV
jgi:hypothetical protein